MYGALHSGAGRQTLGIYMFQKTTGERLKRALWVKDPLAAAWPGGPRSHKTMYEAPNGACNPGCDKTDGPEKGGPWDKFGLLVPSRCPDVGLVLLRRPGTCRSHASSCAWATPDHRSIRPPFLNVDQIAAASCSPAQCVGLPTSAPAPGPSRPRLGRRSKASPTYRLDGVTWSPNLFLGPPFSVPLRRLCGLHVDRER